MILMKKKQKPAKSEAVGTNSFTYDPETDTYNSKYSLNEVKIKGDKKKYNPIGQNVSAANNRFAMNYLYPAMLGAGALGAIESAAAGPIENLAGYWGGLMGAQGAAAAGDAIRARDTINPFAPVKEGEEIDKTALYNPYSRRFFNQRKRVKVK